MVKRRYFFFRIVRRTAVRLYRKSLNTKKLTAKSARVYAEVAKVLTFNVKQRRTAVRLYKKPMNTKINRKGRNDLRKVRKGFNL
jgi:uncharacterized protein YqeY